MAAVPTAAVPAAQRAARACFGLTAAAVAAGLAIQLAVTAQAVTGFFATPAGRTLNVFAFFTVESNIIVGVTCLLLAARPRRPAGLFAVARMTGLVAITITGLVYHVALRGLLDLDGWGLAADVLLHTVVPVLAVAGWLAFGPGGLVSWRVAAAALGFPVAWLAFTLIRGAVVGWYPYPFIDVTSIGYAQAAVNACWVAALFAGLAAGYTALDRRLPGRRSAGGTAASKP